MGSNTIFSVIIILLFLFSIISSLVKLKQTKKEWNKIENRTDALAKNNKFIVEKREKYERIMDYNVASLDSERKIYRQRLIITGVLFLSSMAIYLIFRKPIFIPLIPISVIFPSILWGKNNISFLKKSNQMFNETVSLILKEYDSNLSYYPTNGFKHAEYNSLYFAEPCNVYQSSDMIINLQSGFCYADVLIESITNDDEGTTYNVEFDGSLARMNITNIGCTIILGGLGSDSFKKSDTFKLIEFENNEFNKSFICFSNNELTAYKILTPDVMEQFNIIKNNSIGDIDIRIINDKLYIRFSDTNGFDGAEGSKDELFKSIAVLDQIIKTMTHIKELIENKIMSDIKVEYK